MRGGKNTLQTGKLSNDFSSERRESEKMGKIVERRKKPC